MVGGRSVRTDHGGDENDGGEENVSLHVESFVREKILLNYLCASSLVNERRMLKSKTGE
jgi:hypothetical protein